LLALVTRSDFEIGGSVRIDVSRQEQFIGVISDCRSIRKFHHGKTIIEDFESGLLSFPLKHVAHHEDRLTLPLGAEIAEGVARCTRA
jgi:hypothetical protein